MKYILVLLLALASCEKRTPTELNEYVHGGHLYVSLSNSTLVHAEHCPAPKHICSGQQTGLLEETSIANQALVPNGPAIWELYSPSDTTFGRIRLVTQKQCQKRKNIQS